MVVDDGKIDPPKEEQAGVAGGRLVRDDGGSHHGGGQVWKAKAKAAAKRGKLYADQGVALLWGVCVEMNAESAKMFALRMLILCCTPQHLHAAVLTDLRHCLPSSLLLEVPPNGPFTQNSHTFLLKGSLHAVAPERAIASQPRYCSLTQAHGPYVLPWLWCKNLQCNMGSGTQLGSVDEWRAGVEGATLLVCLTNEGEVPAAVQQQQQDGNDGGGDEERMLTASPTLRPSLLRQGRSASGGDASLVSGASPRDNGRDGSSEGVNSLMGSAALSMGRELSRVLRRVTTEVVGRRKTWDGQR
jgi:hypothetical protein